MIIIVAIIISYLIGSIPTGYLLVKMSEHRDIRSVGSRSIGATNVLRAKGWKYGIIVAVLDILKGFVPAFAAFKLFNSPGPAAACALATVLGHCFPFSIGFKGGKGVATAMGAYAGLAPLPFLISVVIFIILTAITRYVSLASVVICSLFPFMILITKGPVQLVYGSTIIGLLIIFRHRANLARLVKGTERKLGEKTQ